MQQHVAKLKRHWNVIEKLLYTGPNYYKLYKHLGDNGKIVTIYPIKTQI